MSGQSDKREAAIQLTEVLDKIHDLIDSHPRTVRNSAYICGGVGIVLVLRSIHVAKIFRHGRDIPHRFIRRGVSFQGHVKEINSNGTIYAQHIPILDLRLPWLRTPRTDMLPLTLAFVELNSTSKEWLNSNLSDRKIWFKVLRVEDDGNILQTAIFQQKFWFLKTCVNETLVRDGLCRISHITDFELKSLTRQETDLLDNMIKLEKTADQKGRGIWKEEKPPLKDKCKQILYKCFLLPVDIWKYVYRKVRKK